MARIVFLLEAHRILSQPPIIESILLHTNLITNVKWNRIFVLIWLNTLPWNPVNVFCSVEHLRQIIFWPNATKQKHIQRFTIQQNDQKPTIVHFRPMASKVDSLGTSNVIRNVLSYYWFLLLPFLRIEYKMIENLSKFNSNLASKYEEN